MSIIVQNSWSLTDGTVRAGCIMDVNWSLFYGNVHKPALVLCPRWFQEKA